MRPPRVVDYMITGVCNLACPFCFGPDPNDPSALTELELRALLRFLCSQGVAGINIAGGEPTMSPLLAPAFRYAKSLGLWTALQTNGTRMAVVRECLPFLDWLALPLDSLESSTSEILRTSRNHSKTTLRAFRRPEIVAARKNGLRVKIGTVVTRQNIDQLDSLAEAVEELRPDVWKIHQLRPRGAGRENRDYLDVPDADFAAATAKVRGEHRNLTIAPSMAETSPRSYLIVNPDSTLLVTLFDTYLSYGRLILDNQTVNKCAWVGAVNGIDGDAHLRNIRNAFAEYGPTSQVAPTSRVEEGCGEDDCKCLLERVRPFEVVDRDGR